jgi:hypothetical protein
LIESSRQRLMRCIERSTNRVGPAHDLGQAARRCAVGQDGDPEIAEAEANRRFMIKLFG